MADQATDLEGQLADLVVGYRRLNPQQQLAFRRVLDKLMPAPASSSSPTTPKSLPSQPGSTPEQQEEFRRTGLLPQGQAQPASLADKVAGELAGIKQVAALDPTNRLLADGIRMVEQAVGIQGG